MKTSTRILAALMAAAAIAATVTACGPTQGDDLRNSPNSYPDYSTTVLNVDGFPNIAVICFKGAGFATTSRDYDALTRVPEWDAFCASKAGK